MSLSTRKTLGWVVAALGGLMLLLGLSLMALAIILQLFDPAGPGNNLQGFLVVAGLCPLPLIVVGGAVLAMGVAIVVVARREAASPTPEDAASTGNWPFF